MVYNRLRIQSGKTNCLLPRRFHGRGLTYKLMLYRPKFCANCGEKIERESWGVLTSRRFCPLCETQFKGQDLIPRVVVGAGLLIGLFGFGSYLKSGNADTEGLAVRQPLKPVEQSNTLGSGTAAKPEQSVNTANAAPSQIAALTAKPQPPVKVAADEPQYFCGAETKKGTPCSRRVKGNIRCYQHTGMPAMASADKLRIK